MCAPYDLFSRYICGVCYHAGDDRQRNGWAYAWHLWRSGHGKRERLGNQAGWQCDTCRRGAKPCNDPALCRGPSATEVKGDKTQ